MKYEVLVIVGVSAARSYKHSTSHSSSRTSSIPVFSHDPPERSIPCWDPSQIRRWQSSGPITFSSTPVSSTMEAVVAAAAMSTRVKLTHAKHDGKRAADGKRR